MTWFVGVDVGGTFTDVYALDLASGRFDVYKTPSTPDNPAEAIVTGLVELARQAGIDPADVERFSHGTTVATNALLQRKGGRVTLLTTAGFRDLIEIGRQIRPRMYSLQDDFPPPVVAPQDRVEVAERVTADGSVRRPLTEAEIDRVVAAVRERAPDACAICFLFAFLAPEHEAAVARRLADAMPGLYISRSSEVQPEFREFERLSTTVVNAFLQPSMDTYLATLEREIGRVAPNAQVGINQSSGGLMSIDRARRFPVRTALSGPTAGAVGAAHVARQSGISDIVTLDMGGTSADVCLIRGYEVEQAFERDVGGFPIRLPVVDINTIGAGGGSIAWFDTDGLMKVGPISAGAVPGPACYGKGGVLPTVSDANAVLGRIGGRGLIGGRMGLDVAAARTAVASVAERLGTTVERAARGIIDIVDANMVRAIRAVSVERGHDPRALTLMPFGGAGALHATGVARALEIGRILVPRMPGILCAQGLIVSDLKEDFVRTVRLPLEPPALPRIEAVLSELVAAAQAWFAEEGIPPAERRVQASADLRYVGQNYELRVPVPSDATAIVLGDLIAGFQEAHVRAYGYAPAQGMVELVNLRTAAIGRLAKPERAEAIEPAAGAPVPVGSRPVHFDDDAAHETPTYARESLRPGHTIVGPAIIDQMDATTPVFPGDVARVDGALNILIEVTR